MKNIKKSINLFMLMALILGTSSQVFAEEIKTTSEDNLNTPTQIREELEKEKEGYKMERDALKDEARAKIEALKTRISEEKNKAKATLQNVRIASREKMLKSFDNGVENIVKHEDRLKEYITKLEAMKVDTTVAKTYLATADMKLALAKTKITEAYTLISVASLEKEISVEDKAKLKALSEEIRGLLKEARESINLAVKSLKEGLKAKREEMKVPTNTQTTN